MNHRNNKPLPSNRNERNERLWRLADKPNRRRRNVRVALGGSLTVTPASAIILETLATRERRPVNVIASALIESGADLVDVLNGDAKLHLAR